jgi:hypothetical protein
MLNAGMVNAATACFMPPSKSRFRREICDSKCPLNILGGAALTIIRHGSFLGETGYSIEITSKYHVKASSRRFSLPSQLKGCCRPGRVHIGTGEVMKTALAPFALCILAAALTCGSKTAGQLRQCASSPLFPYWIDRQPLFGNTAYGATQRPCR